MPQIAQILETYVGQAFWLLIVFGLIYFVIGRGMLPKIEATVDDRNRKIAEDLAAAERAKAEAEALEVGLQSKIADARGNAQAEAVKAKAKASKDAEARLAKADAEVAEKVAAAEKTLEKSRVKALGNVEAVAADAAVEIVAKVSGVKVSAAQAAKAVKTVMANG